MAEAEEFVDDSGSSGSESAGKKKWLSLVIALALIGGEGGGIFLLTRMIYKQPEVASADAPDPQAEARKEIEQEVELTLPEVNAFNKREGRLFLYNLQVTIRVAADVADDVQKILEIRQSTILDRLNTVIRSAEVRYLNEPGLDTLRRQFRFELDKILGDDETINALLIPKFYQSPADL